MDDEDFERVNKLKWYVVKLSNTNYAQTKIKINGNWKSVFMHRFILNPENKIHIDHINHDGLNNCKYNIRLCTPSQNHMNRNKIKNLSSIFKGVFWDNSRNKWSSIIRVNKILKYLGFFDSEIDAAKAYNEAALKYFGDFAKLNNIN